MSPAPATMAQTLFATQGITEGGAEGGLDPIAHCFYKHKQ